MNNILTVKNLTKTFKKELSPSINNLSFDLKEGEKMAVIGPDGSGKTTLLRLLSGLILPDFICKNKISPVYINGFSPYFEINKIKKIIGYMPQKFGLYEDLSVIENLELYANLKNIKKEDRKEIFGTLLKFSGLENFKNRLTGNLSGGMKQKLGLSCALLAKPRILFLDEPSVGVDPISRRDLIELTNNLSNKNNISIIWSTSYLEEAKFFDKILILKEGEKIYDGSIEYAKEKMDGLVFYTNNSKKEKRELLNELLSKNDEIQDARIEGEKIRVVFKNKIAAKNFSYEKEKTEPLFEDFVMGLFAKKESESYEKIEKSLNFKGEIAIESKNLTKKFGDFIAADNINFQVKRGEIFGLLGPNGAGKSTIFKMLCSLLTPTSGTSKICGLDIYKKPIEAKRTFGYMAQKFSLFENLSVKQNVELFIGVYKVNEKAEKIIKGFGLEKYINKKAASLPLGYKQRLALLCALINKPPVLFLDEPTSGVDPVSRKEFWMRINNLAKNQTSVLITTHFMDEAQFCDRVALIYKGKILVIDTPYNLKNSIKNEKNQNPTMEDAFIEIIRSAS